MCSDLRRIRKQATEISEQTCCELGWRPGQVYDLSRLTQGVASLIRLAAIIQVTDAETNHLVKARVLPPLPEEVVAEFDVAVKLATKRLTKQNPLVGRTRLQRILQQLDKYWSDNTALTQPPLDDTVQLQTIVDVIDCLPRTNLTMTTTEYGIRGTCSLLPCMLLLYPPHSGPSGANYLLPETEDITCVQSIYIHIFSHLPTCAGKFARNFVDATRSSKSLAIDNLTLEVTCKLPQNQTVCSLCQIKEVTAKGFRLITCSKFGTTVLAMSHQGQHYFRHDYPVHQQNYCTII